ncbi:hypothetical protein PsorP6_014489 [Peronosclerospora sorghi]|uniref:Uncharacterized protein n=1 Tax=Peronosclerospora sorghi TaxID=230839 RepID=A0ACC0VTI5_9STRA|nr:hypothetical protein PsorP6_014489 [Peronosclerospora sorghi]
MLTENEFMDCAVSLHFPSYGQAPAHRVGLFGACAHWQAHWAERNIGMCVIWGGSTPYVHAGDISIYKFFQDKK